MKGDETMILDRKKYELARARACMSFEDVVEAGIKKGTLCRMLKGSSARPETIGKLAKVLNVDVSEII